MNNEKINNAILWATEYIKEYNKNYTINPFMHTDNARMQRKQKLYIECCDFLQTIETFTDDHKQRLNKINAM